MVLISFKFEADLTIIKGEVHSKNMLISDERFEITRKNAIDCFSLPRLVLEMFVFNVEKLVRWRPPSSICK